MKSIAILNEFTGHGGITTYTNMLYRVLNELERVSVDLILPVEFNGPEYYQGCRCEVVTKSQIEEIRSRRYDLVIVPGAWSPDFKSLNQYLDAFGDSPILVVCHSWSDLPRNPSKIELFPTSRRQCKYLLEYRTNSDGSKLLEKLGLGQDKVQILKNSIFYPYFHRQDCSQVIDLNSLRSFLDSTSFDKSSVATFGRVWSAWSIRYLIDYARNECNGRKLEFYGQLNQVLVSDSERELVDFKSSYSPWESIKLMSKYQFFLFTASDNYPENEGTPDWVLIEAALARSCPVMTKRNHDKFINGQYNYQSLIFDPKNGLGNLFEANGVTSQSQFDQLVRRIILSNYETFAYKNSLETSKIVYDQNLKKIFGSDY